MGRWSVFALVLSAMLFLGCSLPINQLTAEDRKADLNWAFSIFKQNYAPSELKQKNYGVDLESVEQECLDSAEGEMSNQEFLSLFQKCIHRFKDAHIGALQVNSGFLPEYAQVAHLGFLTSRTKVELDGKKENALKIVSRLKGSDTSAAPLVEDDLIVAINGLPVDQYLKETIVPFIDVGHDEANLTMAAFRFGMRASTDLELPEDLSLQLKVLRGNIDFLIEIPWIQEDLLSFLHNQNKNSEENNENQSEIENEGLVSSNSYLMANPMVHRFLGYESLQQLMATFQFPLEKVVTRLEYIAHTGFQLSQINPLMKSVFQGNLDLGAKFDQSLRLRNFPMAETVNDLMFKPLFKAKLVTKKSGQRYAYLQIGSFPADDKLLTEWNRAITAIEDKGVKSVVIDLVDNTGGSLVHGMRMLNLLRKRPLEYPSLQFRLNNNWMNTFKSQATFGEDAYQKSIANRVVSDFEEDIAKGKQLSRPISVKVMDPFFLQNPGYGLSDDVQIALLINEMCVSMCEIFASSFQDNDLGVVIGQRSMGGGGNVVQHGLSPISKIGMALTESLVVSSRGEYIEDRGVIPDVRVDMVAGRESGFAEAFEKAYEYIFPLIEGEKEEE